MVQNSILTPQFLSTILEDQINFWPLAKKNYEAFSRVERKSLRFDDYSMAVQFNPARIVSTTAKVKDGMVADRPCFLCEKNRPHEQLKLSLLPGWDLLVNPYPIFPMHFTIVSKTHRPQESIPLEIVEIAEKMPGMVVFYNGASAGASAPDHLHMQAVLAAELPLIKRVEAILSSSSSGYFSSEEIDKKFPFLYFSGLICPDAEAQSVLSAALMTGGPSTGGHFTDMSKVNSFFWTDKKGILRFLSIPRQSHRPSCFFASDNTQRLVSPGCIDMAGVIITPRQEDFELINEDDVRKIYNEVAVSS